MLSPSPALMAIDLPCLFGTFCGGGMTLCRLVWLSCRLIPPFLPCTQTHVIFFFPLSLPFPRPLKTVLQTLTLPVMFCWHLLQQGCAATAHSRKGRWYSGFCSSLRSYCSGGFSWVYSLSVWFSSCLPTQLCTAAFVKPASLCHSSAWTWVFFL
jgi:hypothetical protein